jgi:hypothetical protein
MGNRVPMVLKVLSVRKEFLASAVPKGRKASGARLENLGRRGTLASRDCRVNAAIRGRRGTLVLPAT